MSKDELPSIEQFVSDDNLPSIEEFLTEEVEQELPSVEDFVEKEEDEIKELVEEFVPEEKSLELNEVLRLINDVRESIPDIPEIKYYDKELEDICESIQILASSIPEVKYYDSDIENLQSQIQEVKSEIPNVPKWINEVNNIPDFSWIGKTITILDNKTSLIDDNFSKVNDSIETLRERIEINIRDVVEENEVRHFENKVQIESEIKDLEERYQESKDNIWKELRESSLKIWEYHKEFKDDDRKLKKEIINEYNLLKINLEEKLKEFNNNSVKTDQVLLNYFEKLKEEIANLPEVKFYDEDILNLNHKIEKIDGQLSSLDYLYDLVETIKLNQIDLEEQLSNKSLSLNDEDPLTPLNQNFATLEDLSSHYRLFINRIQQQLSTIGGGGETRLKYLDDIVGIATNASAYDGKFLKYNHSTESFVFETVSGGGGGGGESYWASTSVGIHTLSNVGVGTTAKSDFKLFVEGNAKITGILTVGNQSVTIDGTNNTVNVGSGVTINGNTGIISATAIYVGGSQVSTFSGNYNDLTNKPDLSTISVAYATTAGISTALQNSRTFEITGDIIASPISFDGTGNVSLAATIQPNSVALGGDTTGDYVQSITGTSNQITVTSGTGEGSTPTLSIPSQFTAPQDVTITRDLQVNRNLNVNGNITIGGTAATLFTTEFKVYDPDIVLGFRTDALGNDISTDNTANHGGIAIASTEGTPLISLYDVGVGETNPATYKKFMWFKSGTFFGLGTDAWISNYAIGIGSTQVPNGVRLSAGGMQVTDSTLSVPQLNISGVTTSTGGFVGNITGTATTATNLSDAANITTGTINSARLTGTYHINVSYATTAGIATVAQGLTGTPHITVGVVTSTSFVKSGGTSSQFLKADGSVDSSNYLTTTGSGTNLTGIVTSIVAGDNITISGSTGQVTINSTGGGGGSTLGIATAGGTVGTGVTLLDFRGSGISTVTVSSGIATINIEGGGSLTPEISSVMMSMIF
jgi:hypothetical protein